MVRGRGLEGFFILSTSARVVTKNFWDKLCQHTAFTHRSAITALRKFLFLLCKSRLLLLRRRVTNLDSKFFLDDFLHDLLPHSPTFRRHAVPIPRRSRTPCPRRAPDLDPHDLDVPRL